MLNLTKIRSVEAALMLADRRADMAKVVGTFRDYTKALKKVLGVGSSFEVLVDLKVTT
jgi:hypothetical protein